MTSEEFHKSCALWCTGVSIVTSTDLEGRDRGLTLNSVTSVSVGPPLLLICLDNVSDTLKCVNERGAFCINLLSSDQQNLSDHFATKDEQKFTNLRPERGVLGVPILTGCLVSFECKVEAVYPGGDHSIIVGHLKNIVEGRKSASPLIFINGKYG